MELGLAIGVFIIVAFVLMTLFCVVTRYFNYKLRKALEQQAQVYSLIQGIEGDRQDINEGEYQDFVHKRIADRKQKQLQKDKNYKVMIQMVDINEPLKDSAVNIYGVSKLKRKLDTQQETIKQSVRSIASPKSQKPQKPSVLRYGNFDVGTNRSNSTTTNKKTPIITTHKSLSKIVCYTEQGITIIETNVEKLSKTGQQGIIKQYKNVETNIIKTNSKGFRQTMQAYGFQQQLYGAYKFYDIYQIVNMKPRMQYATSSLKKTQQKQQMQFPSFYIYKQNLEEKGQMQDNSQGNILDGII